MDRSKEKMSAHSKVLSLDRPRGEMKGLNLGHLTGIMWAEDLDPTREYQKEKLRPWVYHSEYCLVIQ